MIDWHAFHFIRPNWLLAIIPLIVLALLFRYFKRQRSGWQQVLPNHLHNMLLSGPELKSERKRQLPRSLLVVAWLLSCIALAGPTWEKLPQPVYNVKHGSVVVLDMSLSMRATDIAPDRLTRARFKAIDQINGFETGSS